MNTQQHPGTAPIFELFDFGITFRYPDQTNTERSDNMIRSMGELFIYQMGEVATCDKDRLTDLSRVEVDKDLPVVERVRDYIHQVGNPYLFKVGDTAVKIEFGGGSALADSIAKIINAG